MTAEMMVDLPHVGSRVVGVRKDCLMPLSTWRKLCRVDPLVEAVPYRAQAARVDVDDDEVAHEGGRIDVTLEQDLENG